MLNRFGVLFCAATLLSAFTLVGCVEDDESRADRTAERLNEIHEAAVSDWCSCYGDVYSGTYNGCMDEFYVEVELSECERDAVACHVDDFEDYLRCEQTTTSFLSSCIAQCTDNDATRQSCLESWQRRQDDCLDRISDSLQHALTSCTLGNQPGCSPW